MATILALDGVLVTIGVDTHRDTLTAVALDQRGGRLDAVVVANHPGGFAELVAWAEQLGVIDAFAVEGTGSYGGPLARWLAQRGFVVGEVNRGDRADRRRRGKNDRIDAEQAARSLQAGKATTPKAATGPAESIRMLRIARRSAVSDRTRTANRLHALRVTAPETLRGRLAGLTLAQLVSVCARLRAGRDLTDPVNAAKVALRALARRYQQLSDDIGDLDAYLDPLVASVAPTLVAALGVGTDVAGGLLVAAGDNPQRLTSDAAFAALCGVSPVEASSGKTVRHRLNRGGNRDANRCLHTVALVRLRYHQPTRDYLARRMAEGKTRKEAIRCLKRYLARQLHRAILTDLAQTRQPAAA